MWGQEEEEADENEEGWIKSKRSREEKREEDREERKQEGEEDKGEYVGSEQAMSK